MQIKKNSSFLFLGTAIAIGTASVSGVDSLLPSDNGQSEFHIREYSPGMSSRQAKFPVNKRSLPMVSFPLLDRPDESATAAHDQMMQTGNWKLDKSRSSIRFTVQHMVVSESEGYFRAFDGSMESVKPDFSDARINFTIDVNSIDTDSEKRDEHLKSEDFFNAAKYPSIRFVSTSFKQVRGKKYQLQGNLTIRDITRPVVFDVVYGGTTVSGKSSIAIFTCTTSIDRFEYGLKWNKATEAGGLVVGQKVSIAVKVEMTKTS